MEQQVLFAMRATSLAFLVLVSAIAGSARAQPPDPAVSEYAWVIHSVIQREWLSSLGSTALVPSSSCSARITQLPGGTVLDVDFLSNCEFDQAGRTAITEAVYRSDPLPYEGFEDVFQREVSMVFHAPSVESPEAAAARLAAVRRVHQDAYFEKQWHANVGIPRQQAEYKQRCRFDVSWWKPTVWLERKNAVTITVDTSGQVVSVVGTGGEPVEEALVAALHAAPPCEPVPEDLFVGAETVELDPMIFHPRED
ncbi:cell envelope integrity protein TolA [Alkalisalibacterium limincola]|uniref:TonB C-terminal domain-containing protein n=1 Tax=Alkalisalibacterium limincola TaxID=2699169 RepID=A0A5C8KUE0_9GAMM|nr:cell envelope integrity protein TolA [Alkalisalibacterium limincola]TXK64531.1 TonB C-terminal domain-containing protein [Alkalisalibacterium limincola]